jgi:heme-degrading monooxygenase HmoA
MPIRVVLTVDIKPGEEGEFEREFGGVASSLKDARGLLGQVLCRDADNVSRYHIMSDWSSREEFREFEVSPEQDEATAPVRKHRSSVRMAIYEVVFRQDGSG